MTTPLDKAMAADVKALIAGFRATTDTITVNSSEAYDPATGAVTATGTAHTVTISPPLAYDERWIGRGNVEQGDAKIYIAADGLEFTPDTGQVLTVAGLTWRIVGMTPLFSGDDIAAYKLHVRR